MHSNHNLKNNRIKKVFISYTKRSYCLVASDLKNDLTQVYKDIDIWFDEDIDVGQQWWDKILEEIKSCDLFLIIHSTQWKESKACQLEFDYAYRLEKDWIYIPTDASAPNQVIAVKQSTSMWTQDNKLTVLGQLHSKVDDIQPTPNVIPEQDEPPCPLPELTVLEAEIDQIVSARDYYALACKLRNIYSERPSLRSNIQKNLLNSLEKKRTSKKTISTMEAGTCVRQIK